MLYICVCVFTPPQVWRHNWMAEKCWKINQRHQRHGKERIKHFSSTFLPLPSFSAPLLSLLALQQFGAQDEQSVPLQIRSAGGWQEYTLGPQTKSILDLTFCSWCSKIDCTGGIGRYQTNNWFINLLWAVRNTLLPSAATTCCSWKYNTLLLHAEEIMIYAESAAI